MAESAFLAGGRLAGHAGKGDGHIGVVLAAAVGDVMQPSATQKIAQGQLRYQRMGDVALWRGDADRRADRRARALVAVGEGQLRAVGQFHADVALFPRGQIEIERAVAVRIGDGQRVKNLAGVRGREIDGRAASGQQVAHMLVRGIALMRAGHGDGERIVQTGIADIKAHIHQGNIVGGAGVLSVPAAQIIAGGRVDALMLDGSGLDVQMQGAFLIRQFRAVQMGRQGDVHRARAGREVGVAHLQHKIAVLQPGIGGDVRRLRGVQLADARGQALQRGKILVGHKEIVALAAIGIIGKGRLKGHVNAVHVFGFVDDDGTVFAVGDDERRSGLHRPIGHRIHHHNGAQAQAAGDAGGRFPRIGLNTHRHVRIVVVAFMGHVAQAAGGQFPQRQPRHGMGFAAGGQADNAGGFRRIKGKGKFRAGSERQGRSPDGQHQIAVGGVVVQRQARQHFRGVLGGYGQRRAAPRRQIARVLAGLIALEGRFRRQREFPCKRVPPEADAHVGDGHVVGGVRLVVAVACRCRLGRQVAVVLHGHGLDIQVKQAFSGAMAASDAASLNVPVTVRESAPPCAAR